MKKVVLRLDLHDDKAKQKAMKAVSSLSGVDSIVMDMKEKKLTVTGDVDPVTVVAKLRKAFHTEILTVGPAKEEKKDQNKKGDDKKDNPTWHTSYNYPYFPQPYCQVVTQEENPTTCVIC